MEQSFVNIRIDKKMKRQRDPFYSRSNMTALSESLSQLDSGNVIVKTMKELENMENE